MADPNGSSLEASDTLDASKDFVALDPSADAWDDTALISAFDRAVASYRQPGARRSKQVEQPAQDENTDMPKSSLPIPPSCPPLPQPLRQVQTKRQRDTRTAQNGSESMMLPPPPPPPGTDANLRDLLSAWYEAGFRAGVYSAGHGTQR